MSETTTGSFIDTPDGLVWRRITDFELKDTERLYLAHKSGDEPHLIYKLCKAPTEADAEDARKYTIRTAPYYWGAMWNTCAHSGAYFASIEAAIRDCQARGYVVIQTNFNAVLRNTFHEFK